MTKFYGLTGGIGSGKSTAANFFKESGIPTLDLDQVGKDIIQQDPSILTELTEAFGKNILRADKTLNRKELAKLAFQDKTNTNKLNQIMHPRIREAENKWRRQQTSPFAIIEASVLIESGDVKRMDALIVILCDPELRRQRALKRGKQSQETFNQIEKRQCSDKTRQRYANHIFENNHNLEQLRSLVQHFVSAQQY